MAEVTSRGQEPGVVTPERPSRPLRLGAWAVPLLFLLGALVRAADLKRPFRGIYAWNESYYAIIAANFPHYGWRQQVGPDGPLFTSNPLVPWMIAASFHRFGLTEAAARLPFFLLSLVSLASLYGLARAQYPDRPGIARWTLLLGATMPGLVFFSRNIQLDGPMTALGLLGLWMAVLFRRERRPIWLVASLLAMALCVTLKYTGVLALPAWWVALGLAPRLERRDWGRGAALTVLVLLPAALAIHWVTSLEAAAPAPIHGLSTHNYFLRFSEWRLSAFRDALQATWATLPAHWGRLFWYPFLLGMPWLLPGLRNGLVRHRLVFAMILPWYLQIGYPQSWVTNEYYDYFALYGVALGGGLLLAHFSARQGSRAWAFVTCALIISNLWDYRTVFHVTYFPYDIVREATPFESAKLVRERDVSHAPILCEQSQTMFYADPDPAVTSYAWWEDSKGAFTDGIRSGRYRYVVFEYEPPTDALLALPQSGYRQIAPGAWEKP